MVPDRARFALVGLSLLAFRGEALAAPAAPDAGPVVTKDGDLDPDKVARAVKSRLGPIKACYERAVKNKPSLAGRVTMHWTITPAGTVAGVSVESDTLGDRSVSDCITLVVAKLTFAPPSGGSVDVSFPFVFQPSEPGAPPTVPERRLYYDRAITGEDLEGRTLRELALMQNMILFRAGQPVLKGWLRYYLPGSAGDRVNGPPQPDTPPGIDRQNAAFLARYEKALPRADLERRFEAIVDKHRYAGAPDRGDYAFRAFSSDGHSALLTNQTGGMRVDVLTGRPLSTWNRTKRSPGPIPAAMTSALFAGSGSKPPSADLEKGAIGKLADALTHQGRWDRELTLSPDGSRLLAGPAFRHDEEGGDGALVDGHFEVVDAASGKTILSVRAEVSNVCAVFLPGSRRLLVAQAKIMTLWDLDSAKALWSKPQPAAPGYQGAPDCLCLTVAPDGKTAFLDSAVIDLGTGAILNVLAIGFHPVYAEFSPDSERIFVAGSAEGPGTSFNTAPAIWNVRRGVRIRSLATSNAVMPLLSQVAWSPDGRWVLLGGQKGPMLFDVATGEPVPAFAGHERWWNLDEKVEALLLARRLHRQIPALRDSDL